MTRTATRRQILIAAACVALRPPAASAQSAEHLAPTPDCADHDQPTPAQTEGPYFTPNSPLKTDFSQDGPGAPVILAGFALSTRCEPLADALVELWHADARGAYDNGGFRFRGHQFTDENGRFLFRTIRPGLYPGRTRHYHLKAQPAGGRMLTTQLYFPNEPANDGDGLFDPALRMKLSLLGEGVMLGRFDLALISG